MQGDEVLVDEAPPGRDGRRSGRIARVLTRRNPTVVGIFHYARTHRRSAWDNAPLIDGNYVTPLDERMAGSPGGGAILIPEGAEVPATPKETPHRVLGEEAQASAGALVGRAGSAQTARGVGGRCGDYGFSDGGKAGARDV